MSCIIDSDIGFAGLLPAIKKGETITRDGKAYVAIRDVMQNDLVKIEGEVDSPDWNEFFKRVFPDA